MTPKSLYEFTDNAGSFRVQEPGRTSRLYLPLCNEWGMLGSITPHLQGDLTYDQHSFLTPPLTAEDLHLNRATFNFWITQNGQEPWSVSGHSVWQRAQPDGAEPVTLEAGLVWQRLTRTAKKRGLEARVLNFVPSADLSSEVMLVEIKNISTKPLAITGTAAIPLFGRSADNIRDHRHVTSLLNRISDETHGLKLTPTMSFNERGHLINETSYFVVGTDGQGQAPAGFFPTIEAFVEEGGDLEKPGALINGSKPRRVGAQDQGREALGGLQFKPITLKPKQSATYILFIGIDRKEKASHAELVKAHGAAAKVTQLFDQTEAEWRKKGARLQFQTGDADFNRWMMWVKAQPVFRKIFGNSFLPDFDYGRGGRGWRDLWQDCLALLLADPAEVRADMLKNFGGVRLDGSNATIIGRKRQDTAAGIKWIPEFIADRNNIVRTWMDHGIWPCYTTLLYIHQTGDFKFLDEKVTYFRDVQIYRGRKKDTAWDGSTQHPLAEGGAYQGAVAEHILVQTLVPFFNVGEHNNMLLEDADWNDGLDMAHEKGESVAFTSLFAGNMEAFANALEKAAERSGLKELTIFEELLALLDRASKRVNYDSVDEKRRRLQEYFASVSKPLSGKKASVPVSVLVLDLREKAAWIRKHLNEREWVSADGQSWFNGYYNNQGQRVEGKVNGRVRMTLTGQVFPIMAGIADEGRVTQIAAAVQKYLFDSELGGIRLNSDFGGLEPSLGRAFSFVYGDKENGAVFSHMVVMYANALYQRGFVREGRAALRSLFQMAKNTERSRIFPVLPEYFNGEGRGLYLYLTGSASWYVYTMLTQVFGVRGEAGDLLLAPKLMAADFDKKGEARVECRFAGARVQITFQNPDKAEYDNMRIDAVTENGSELPVTKRGDKEALIQREILSQKKEWALTVRLKKAGR